MQTTRILDRTRWGLQRPRTRLYIEIQIQKEPKVNERHRLCLMNSPIKVSSPNEVLDLENLLGLFDELTRLVICKPRSVKRSGLVTVVMESKIILVTSSNKPDRFSLPQLVTCSIISFIFVSCDTSGKRIRDEVNFSPFLQALHDCLWRKKLKSYHPLVLS